MFTVLNVPSYRQKHCLKLCIQAYVLSLCGCLDAGLPNIFSRSTQICDNLTKLECVDSARASYSNLGDKKCIDSSLNIPNCPLECQSVIYSESVARSRYPTNYYTRYLQYTTDILFRFPNGSDINDDNTVVNTIQKNIVLLNVFYENMAITYVAEVAEVTADKLFGDIGGNLGLFVGMCVLSFFEFAEILIEMVLIYFRKKICKTSKKLRQTDNLADKSEIYRI